MSTVTVVVAVQSQSGLSAQPVGILVNIVDVNGSNVAQQLVDSNNNAVFNVANSAADAQYTANAVAVDANNNPVGEAITSAPFLVPAAGTGFTGNIPTAINVTVS